MRSDLRKVATAFIIGSSWVSFVYWFIGFHSYSGKFNKDNCIMGWLNEDPYYIYTIGAPLYIGLMSAFAVILSMQSKLSIRTAFFIIGIISPIRVSIVITRCNIYNFTSGRYKEQYARLLFYHFLLYNVVIASTYERLI